MMGGDGAEGRGAEQARWDGKLGEDEGIRL